VRTASAIAALAAALAPAPAARAAPPATMPEVAAWVVERLTGVEDWFVLGFNAMGITFASPEGATLRSTGFVEGEIRQEYFEPVELDGRIMRSMTSRWTVDCAQQRYALLRITLYARNNLQDRLDERTVAEPRWLARDLVSGDTIDALCDAVRIGERLDAPPGP
jgi:hypothetical protein